MIRMNDDKITTEKKYHLDGIYSTINNTFLTMGLSRFEDGSGALSGVYMAVTIPTAPKILMKKIC